MSESLGRAEFCDDELAVRLAGSQSSGGLGRGRRFTARSRPKARSYPVEGVEGRLLLSDCAAGSDAC
jgi:hypothetical protein